MTADDQPGAGRLLGNLYVALGNPLERKLGILAGKLGYGPRATAVKIDKYREQIQAAFANGSLSHDDDANASVVIGTSGSSSSAKKISERKLEKSLGRMLKYARSVVSYRVHIFRVAVI